MKKTHKIKLNKEFVDDVMSERKTFEIRVNDRGYQTGDHIKFIVTNIGLGEEADTSIEAEEFEITYVLNGWGLKNGYVVFGISRIMHKGEEKGDAAQEQKISPTCRQPTEPDDIREEKPQSEPVIKHEKKIDEGKIWALAHAREPWPARAIAEEMHCSVATVYNRLAKMRKERGED